MNYINLSVLPNIDVTLISTISNLVFVAIIVLVLIGGLIGLLRGVWNASFRLIFIGLLVILAYTLSGTIGNSIAELDLSKIIGAQTIDGINGMSVNVTSIKGTLTEVIAALGTSSGGSLQKTLSDPRTLAIATELALIVVRLITFLLLAILIIIVGNLLATLLYHLIFKHLITKKLRKEVKLRLVAFFEGMLKSGLVLSMLIVPFSAILNSISKAFHNAESVQKENLDNETYNQLMSWIDAYNDSALAKVLFNWTKDSDGNTLDMKLANVITSTSDSTMAFTEELSSLLSLGTSMLASGALQITDTGAIVIDGTILMDSELISVLIAQLTTSNLVLGVLPIAADFALNLDGVSDYIDSEKINLDNINWKEELTTLSDIYSDMYESGIVDEEVLTNPSVMIKRIFNTRDESIHTKLVTTFEKFDQLEIMNQVLPSLVWTMANTEGNVLNDYLPTDWEKYQNIKFGSEFATIYDSVYRINKTTDNAIIDYVDSSLIASNDKSKSLKYENQDEKPVDKSELNKLLDAILDNAKEIVPIFVGEKDEITNTFVNVDENGKIKDGRCLLDSDLLFNSFGKLSSSLVKLITSNFGDIEINADKINAAIENLKTRLDYKMEFGTMLEIVADIASDERSRDLFTSDEIVLNKDICDALHDPLGKVDNSKILQTAIPEILRSVIKNNEASLQEFGISADSINYDVRPLGVELQNILDFTPSLFNILKALNDNKDVEKQLEAINSSDLTNILHGIRDSKIFNDKTKDGKENFLIVVDNLFEKMGYEDGNLTDQHGVVELNDKEWDTEIDNIGDFFDKFKNCNLTKLLNNPDGYLDPDILAPGSVSTLFDSIDNSSLLRVGLGPILDKNLKDMLSSVPNADLSFRNITDWSAEGDNFAKLLDSAQKLNERGISLDNIDFINSFEKDEEGNLLTRNLAVALSKSQLFEDEYGFGNFLKAQLMESAPDLNFYDINKSEEFTKTTQFFNEVSENRKWEDEIDIIFNFIEALQNIGAKSNSGVINDHSGTDGLNIVIDNPQDYRDLFVADGTSVVEGIDNYIGINSSNALRMPIANAIKDASSENIEFRDIDLKIDSRINVQALVDMDDPNKRNTEINTIFDAIDEIQELDGYDFEEIRKDKDKLSKLETSMLLLHDSKMFNTLRITLIDENIEDKADATVFEGIVAEFLNETFGEDAVIGRFGEITELKYDTSLAVVQTLYNSRCEPSVDTNDDWVLRIENGERPFGELTKMFDIIDLAKDIDFDNVSNDEGWIEEHGSVLLPELNSSNLLFRSVPYYINEFINNTDTSNISPDLDLKVAKPEYMYNKFTQEYDAYDDSEISRLVTIVDNYSLLEDVSDSNFSLNKIEEDNNEENIKDTLKALANSHVFHIEGSKDETKDTVFVQIMCISFDKSSLSEIIYDETIHHETYELNGILDAKANTRNKIVSYDDGYLDALKENNNIQVTIWDDEIDRIFNIYDRVIDLKDDDIYLIKDINVKKMNPDQVIVVLKTINNSDLVYDAVPNYIKKAFDNVSLSNFSRFNGENKEEYLIGRNNYYDKIETIQKENDVENSKTIYELDVIHELLKGIVKLDATQADGYARKENGNIEYAIQFSDGFRLSEFKENDKSLTTLVQFLVDSKIFKNCRGLVLENAIKSVGFADYISDRYDGMRLEHTNVFDFIFDKIENLDYKQVLVEGKALDSITDTLEGLVSDTKNGDNTFTSLDSEKIKTVFKNCYIYKYGEEDEEYIKSLLSCEIVGGFLASNIKDSSYLDDYYDLYHANEYLNMWYFDGTGTAIENDFAYTLFNDLEANALASSIDSVKLISNLDDYNNLNNNTVNEIDRLLGLTYEMNEGTIRNSIITTFVYRKGIYDKLMDSNRICNNVYVNKEYVFINNTEAMNQFVTAYEDMAENYSNPFDFENNFNLRNVHMDILAMFSAIVSRAS